jgi:hypothetical protein
VRYFGFDVDAERRALKYPRRPDEKGAAPVPFVQLAAQ